MRWDQGAAIESMRQNYEIHQVALLIEDKMDLPHRKVENKKMSDAVIVECLWKRPGSLVGPD